MKNYFFLSFLFFSIFSNAQVQIVSDVDDTLKASNVRSRVDSLLYAYATENLIKGMPELYSHLVESVNDLKVTYLSSAPKRLLSRSHQEFLDLGRFPDGELVLKSLFRFSSFSHKFKNIEKILKSRKAKILILVGDNGEGDAEVFNAVFEKHGESIQIYQFIRKTYEVSFSPLKKNQIEFVSPLEICLTLEVASLTSCPEDFFGFVVKGIVNETNAEDFGAHYFHPYMNCLGYAWPQALRSESYEVFASLLESRCNSSI